MQYIIITIIIGVIGFLIGKTIQRRTNFDAINQERFSAKEHNKRKILAFLKKRRTITNSQVQKLLGVSDATATNYLEELEQKGALSQKGKTGSGVFYQKS